VNRLDNGWRSGKDPIQRWLRIVATIVCLVVFAWLALDPARRDWPTLTIALGALLVLLGYEAIVRLPYLGRPDNPPGQEAPTYQSYRQYPPVEPSSTADWSIEERPDNVIVTGDDNPPPPEEQ
jgi:hypothetical protein